METDEALMARFQNGSSEAFQALFDRYAAHLVHFAYRLLSNCEESEDLAQEVLLRVYKGKDRYDSNRPFRSWIFCIAHRLISNRLRERKIRRFLSLDWVFDSENREPSLGLELTDKSADANPEEAANKNQMSILVQKALDSLPESQRTAVVLARFEEMSYEEIASAMGVSIPAVKSLLFRARDGLKRSLATQFSK